MDFKLLMFHENVVKISEILNKGNLLKTYLPYHVLQLFLSWEKGNTGGFKTNE